MQLWKNPHGREGRKAGKDVSSGQAPWSMVTSDQGKEAGLAYSIPMATWGNIKFQALLGSLGSREVKQV